MTIIRANRFPVVAIGASAGGVEALTAFFESLPARTHAAFVVITHLAPHRESLLPDILMRHTALPVAPASDGQSLEQGHVYLIPPDAIMTVADDHLVLSSRDGERNPVDIFLTSLAHAVGERAVAIILSGAGTDGAIGVKAVREAGGFTLAQSGSDSSPRHHGMPDAAIATGFVDCVLPIGGIAERIGAYADTFDPPLLAAAPDGVKGGELEAARAALCAVLRERVGHDFSRYKPNTFLRRVERRMQVHRILDLARYVDFVRSDPNEAANLFRDLLIGVTSFFRDPDAYDSLAQLAVPRLFAGKGPGDRVRVWVPGCATGEEVYSLAILLREQMDPMQLQPQLQVFATDVDENALAVARAGRYPAKLLEDMAPARRERFFVREGKSYTIAKEVRDACLFSCHSVVRDPPFLNIDLISCRNLLIYFKTELQNQVIPLFHYALRPGGILFLGASEHVSQHRELFAPLDKKHRVFQRREQPGRSVVAPIIAQVLEGGRRPPVPMQRTGGDSNVMRRAVALLLDRFAPAHVIVDDEWNLVHYSARTGKYLESPSGAPTRNLLAMARRGLQLPLRSAMHEAMKGLCAARRNGVAVELGWGSQTINLGIEPLPADDGEHYWLVVFSDVGVVRSRDEVRAAVAWPADQEKAFLQMEQELSQTRERLQTSIEEYESSVEEQKSANEELLSLNEELQSTNEELETSKEELQSVNEELQTVNVELSAKIEALDRSNSDLRNLFDSTRIATVFLDSRLIIRSFTPAACELFRLIPTDVGRPLSDIATFLDYGGLADNVQTVLASSEAIEKQLTTRNGQAHYLMRVLPYWDSDHRIDGVIVTFVDVTDMVHVGQQKVLVAELNHRVKNVLAVVASMATQLARRSCSVQEFTESFLGRVQGLAHTHDLLARHEWAEISLHDLVAAELAAFAADPGRVAVSGPEVYLRPRATTTLGMVIHELATNAVKYGALSEEGGQVLVSWTMGAEPDAPIEVTWRESGGPSVRAPERKGFGTELIERSLDFELGGNARIEFAATGIIVRLDIPMDNFVLKTGRP